MDGRNKDHILCSVIMTLAFCFAFPQQAWAQQKAAPAPAEPVIKTENVEYTAEDLEDPFKEEEEVVQPQPVEEAPVEKKPLPEMKIQGIIWGGIFPQAIINNTVVKKGDKIDDVRIVDITKDGLVLFFQDEEYTLPAPATKELKILRKKSSDLKGGKNEKE